MAFEDGPFIQVACFCENVLQDTEGSFSLIRIVDAITHTVKHASPPDDIPQFNYDFYMVIALKSGKARGRYDLRVTPELPDGSSIDPMTFSAHFGGEERGQNVIVKLNWSFSMEGLYLFKISLDNENLGTIPLRVLYNRIVAR